MERGIKRSRPTIQPVSNSKPLPISSTPVVSKPIGKEETIDNHSSIIGVDFTSDSRRKYYPDLKIKSTMGKKNVFYFSKLALCISEYFRIVLDELYAARSSSNKEEIPLLEDSEILFEEDPLVIHVILNFIHMGKDKVELTIKKTDDDFMIKLFKAAVKYKMTDLINSIMESMIVMDARITKVLYDSGMALDANVRYIWIDRILGRPNKEKIINIDQLPRRLVHDVVDHVIAHQNKEDSINMIASFVHKFCPYFLLDDERLRSIKFDKLATVSGKVYLAKDAEGNPFECPTCLESGKHVSQLTGVIGATGLIGLFRCVGCNNPRQKGPNMNIEAMTRYYFDTTGIIKLPVTGSMGYILKKILCNVGRNIHRIR